MMMKWQSSYMYKLTIFVTLSLMGFLGAATENPSENGDLNPIVFENRLPGTGEWKPNRSGYRISDDVNGQIKGYASATSVNQGESITFFVTVNPAQNYTITFFRLGWYEGQGARRMDSVSALPGKSQKPCIPEGTTGLITCDWSPGYSFRVPKNWTSGVYLALLTNAEKFQNYVPFVVRDDDRKADLMYQQSVLTLQAYNNYPNDGARGKSLYDHNSFGADTISGHKRAVEVSFDRPYHDSGVENLLDPDWSWEYYFIRWLERSGYDVSYSTDIDTHGNGARLLNYKAFLSVGHDEYWSKDMYDAVERARDAGVNLAFFGANAAYWQVRLMESQDGRRHRVIVCYKNKKLDPESRAEWKTVKWRDAGRPEQKLLGIQYAASWGDPGKNSDYTVVNSNHWIYQNTGLADGDTIQGIIGYEVDRYMEEYPLPPLISYNILSRSPYGQKGDNNYIAMSSIYQTLHGSWVFAAGTMSWSWGLDRDGYADARIQKMTSNLLNRFIKESK